MHNKKFNFKKVILDKEVTDNFDTSSAFIRIDKFKQKKAYKSLQDEYFLKEDSSNEFNLDKSAESFTQVDIESEIKTDGFSLDKEPLKDDAILSEGVESNVFNLDKSAESFTQVDIESEIKTDGFSLDKEPLKDDAILSEGVESNVFNFDKSEESLLVDSINTKNAEKIFTQEDIQSGLDNELLITEESEDLVLSEFNDSTNTLESTESQNIISENQTDLLNIEQESINNDLDKSTQNEKIVQNKTQKLSNKTSKKKVSLLVISLTLFLILAISAIFMYKKEKVSLSSKPIYQPKTATKVKKPNVKQNKNNNQITNQTVNTNSSKNNDNSLSTNQIVTNSVNTNDSKNKNESQSINQANSNSVKTNVSQNKNNPKSINQAKSNSVIINDSKNKKNLQLTNKVNSNSVNTNVSQNKNKILKNNYISSSTIDSKNKISLENINYDSLQIKSKVLIDMIESGYYDVYISDKKIRLKKKN